MGKKASLKVQMLGDFVMSYQGKVIQMGRNQTTKVMQLLQLLLYAGPQGLTRLQIMEKLYNAKMEGDWANNLRVTVFHLRRLLEDTELPKEQYISTQNGRYCFVSSFPIEVDVVRFEELLEEAGTAKDEERGLELLKEACYYYKGYFLPSLSGEEWAVVAGHIFRTSILQHWRRSASEWRREKNIQSFWSLVVGQLHCILLTSGRSGR